MCNESKEHMEERLKRWRYAVERGGMKVSRSKPEYVCVSKREMGGKVKMQGGRCV